MKVYRRKSLAFGIFLLIFTLIPACARAATIVVNGMTYKVIVYQGQNFDANAGALRTVPWWGDQTVAADFANAYERQLGVADTTSGLDKVHFGHREESVYISRFRTLIPLVHSAYVGEAGGPATFSVIDAEMTSPDISFAYAASTPSSVPEINAGSFSQALLIPFALWLVTWRRPASRVA